ncbi:MAG: hypothetical protein GQ581_03140 [Methyloprofundus sp.]|nr:hypothetical protein [Methyloprofundus sp.]
MPKFEPPLLIEIQQSQYLFIFIASVHVLAILSSIVIDALLLVQLLLIVLVCYSFYFHVQRYKQGYYLGTIKYTKEFAWQLATSQQFSAMQILNSSVITSSIIVLHVVSESQHKNMLICCDAVPNEVYRQLRVALKINAQDSE